MKTQKHSGLKVLVCPLDWGLGHAARCVPVIRTLLDLDCEVSIAADGAPGAMLRQEFPQLNHLHLPGYGIRYSKKASLLLIHLLGQLPKLFSRLRQEKRLIQQWTKEHQLDLIISDNRFRCLSAQAKSVYLTHQLKIITSANSDKKSIASKCASWWHRFYYSKFDRIWVPDVAQAPGLAGPMSHPRNPPKNLRYLGPLSRFQDAPSPAVDPLSKGENEEKRGESQDQTKINHSKSRSLIIILSGPEPQRSIWETQILEQFNQTDFSCLRPRHSKVLDSPDHANHTEKSLPWQITLLRGLPHHSSLAPESVIRQDATLRILNHAQSDELQSLLSSATKVLCRAGYSTLMDLIHFDTELYLVPTPGQPEQEFLARNLSQQGCAINWNQNQFHLREVFTDLPEKNYNQQVFGANYQLGENHHLSANHQLGANHHPGSKDQGDTTFAGNVEPESQPTLNLKSTIAHELRILF